MSDTELLPLLFFGAGDAWGRLRGRLEGLTDDEYRWEPVPGCWSVREVDGHWQVDLVRPGPEPAPVTTIAWRLFHIASCLCEYVSQLGPWPLPVERRRWFGDAASALGALDTAWSTFHARIHALGEDGVRRPLGPSWGSFADNSWAELVGHAHDELAHHGAEVALLRDLYPYLRQRPIDG